MILLTFLVGFWIVSSSYVQTKIIYSITQDFKIKTQQNFTIEKVQLQWNGKLQFSDFYIEDHHADTLLFIKKFKTSILDFKKLNKSNFTLDFIEASQVYLNLTKYTNEESHSLKVLLDKLNKDNSQKNKSFLESSLVQIYDGHFTYNNFNKDSSRIININKFNLIGTNFAYQGDSLSIILESLKGVLSSPVQLPFFLKGIISYEPGTLNIKDLEIESQSNKFKGSLTMQGKERTLKNFFRDGSIELEASEGLLFIEHFINKPFYFPKNKGIDFSFSAKGPINSIEFENIKFKNEDVKFNGSFGIKNMFDIERPVFFMDINSIEIFTAGFLSNISTLEANQKKYFDLLNKIEFSGSIFSDKDHFNLDLTSTNDWGEFSVFGSIGDGFLYSQTEKRSIDLLLNLKNISVNKFFENNSEFKLFSAFKLNGNIPLNNPITLNWKAINTRITSPNLEIDNISLEGLYEDKKLRNTLKINSRPLKLKSDILFDFGMKVPVYTVVANLTELDLNSLGRNLDSDKKIFKGVIISNLKGTTLDNLEGELKISSASIINDIQSVFLNPIIVKKKILGKETNLSISNSDCISGNVKGVFKLSQIPILFQNALHQVYGFLPAKPSLEGQYLSFNLNIYEKLLDALYPSLSISKNILLKGTLASEEKRSEFIFDTPILKWNNLQLEDIHFKLDTKNPFYATFLSIGDLRHEFYSGRDFNVISTQLNDTLYFRSEFLSEKNSTIPFNVNFYHTKDKNGISYFGFKKSELPVGNDSWTINPKDSSNEKISYSPISKIFNILNFKAVSGDQTIFLSGRHKNNDEFKFKIDAKNIVLENILPYNPVFYLNGKASFSGSFERSPFINIMDLVGEVRDLTINKEFLGHFNINSNGNTKTNDYYSNLNLVNNDKKVLSGFGFWKGVENPKLNYDLILNTLDLSFLSPIGKEALNKFEGELNGNINIQGPLNKLGHSGLLTLNNGGFRVPYLNIGYYIDKMDIQLHDQVFEFNQVNMKDYDYGTNAFLEGTFSHTNFRDWNANLSIESNRMLLLNKVQNTKSLFFGQGYLKGKVQLEGPTKNLKINLEGKTDNGTSIKIPWSDDYGLSDISFVSFIDKNNKNRFTSNNDLSKIEEINGLEMNFELDVTNDAEIEIVIDQESGSYLTGRGAGNLFMEINTNGKFNMWGDYITYEGFYNFKNLGVIDKKFKVKPGGTIVWEGDPLEAQMDLEAIYDVPGGANPALLLDNPNFNKKIPTDVLIKLQGNLLKPDNPVFQINFPNTSGTVASEINYRLSDPQRSQLQAISLLSQGIFINEVSVSMQGITNNLYQKASDVFSDLIGEENDKLKVGIDYLQGDKSALLDIATEDRLGFTLSTKISDRILLNGKIGVPVGGVEQTLIVGNVQIDFILNQEGSLKAKVFNKENEFRYIGDEFGYTQGVGLSYDVDFDTFKELIKKITEINSETKEEKSKKENPQNKKAIKFINKN